MTERPLRAVLDAVAAGAASTPAVVAATGLAPDVVSGAIDQLERLGRVSIEKLTFGCPGGGCGTCVWRAGDGRGCGPTVPSGRGTARPGLTLVSARRR